ncbi:MAG: nuclear transport factor 2 family protein [Saprospiraceae bacterium]
MKKLILLILVSFIGIQLQAQDDNTKQVERACLNYLEGFYEGDTSKIISTLKPTLYKFGYWKNKDTQEYESQGQMTFEKAVAYSRGVWEKKKFVKDSAPKKVEILDVMNHIAAAKVTAWWGVDYILLTKHGDKWMIDQVLWEGPLEKEKP